MPSTSAPATSSRGRGGKFKKYTRGGGRHFSRDLQPTNAEGNQVSMWSADAQHSSEDDEDSEEESSDEDVGGKAAPAADASREDRKAQKKAKKQAAIAKSQAHTVEVGDLPSSDDDSDDDDDGMLANPNHSKAARKQTAAPAPARGGDVDEITEGVAKMNAPGNRKEREAVAAQAAKERYMKLQAEGKTDQAKADLARLKLIREQRAAEAERRQAEKEEKDAQDKARKAEIEAREKKLREAAAAPKKSKKK
ncbi:Casein kinase substrate, phosphoprotein PP28 [Cordyceps fumosorosea ARSEF 2679]|uniref:Casein kinase substrate, phosphoprotein PP28 n=1 Tax=Cordyceps fumosorosea (strain ARSEF 2679) TaxID=1081104 RepID=A0A168ECD6_CORFA|nr:Casein kinase substrate, phosphoprotein PP28 [Cordyceps fumosorosea ARSEF 2679]OAA73643.1 Casein kinase substrate, phosphoprotein PP28 [Cordyceps fumosorosea ARSEF 2679]